MSENTPASGDPTPDNLPDPAAAADEAAPPPPPPPPPAPEAPLVSEPIPPTPYVAPPPPAAPEVPAASDPIPPAPYESPAPGYAAAPPPAPGYGAAPPPAPGYAAAPPPAPGYAAAPPAGTGEPSSAFAIVSLVTGIAAFVLFWCIGWILSIVSIVFGIIALNKVKNGTGKGKVMAIVGIVFAALTFVVWAVLLVAIRHSGTLTPK